MLTDARVGPAARRSASWSSGAVSRPMRSGRGCRRRGRARRRRAPAGRRSRGPSARPRDGAPMPTSRRIAAGRVVAYARASRPLVGGEAGDLLATRSGGVLRRARPRGARSPRVRRDVLGVVQALGDDHVHEPERQRRVGARQRAHVPVGRRGRARPQRVDHDDPRARLARLLDDRPQVQVGDDRVRPPQHDEAAVERGPRGRSPTSVPAASSVPGRRRPARRSSAPGGWRRAARRSAGPSSAPCTSPCVPA